MAGGAQEGIHLQVRHRRWLQVETGGPVAAQLGEIPPRATLVDAPEHLVSGDAQPDQGGARTDPLHPAPQGTPGLRDRVARG